MSAPTSTALQSVTQAFEENFSSRGELGASLSIWQDGREILALSHGTRDRQGTQPWTHDTLVPVFSSTKAPAAICCLCALHEAGLPLDCPVAEVWPEFVGGGKAGMHFAHLLSHTAGLCALSERVPIYNYEAVVEALERQPPLWEPGTRQGYHARTFGFLMDEIVRRITGAESLGHYFHETFAAPLDLDFWIGLPESEWQRVSPVYPGKISIANADQPFLKAWNSAGTLTQRTFTSPFGINSVAEYNQPALWAPGYASMGGVGSARGLGKWYAMLAQGGTWGGRQILPPSVLPLLTRTLSQGDDEVLLTPVAFAAGVMQDPVLEDPDTGPKKLRTHYGPSLQAYGHPGAGGSLAFADPEHRLAFAYVMNQMEVGAMPGAKVLGLIERLYA